MADTIKIEKKYPRGAVVEGTPINDVFSDPPPTFIALVTNKDTKTKTETIEVIPLDNVASAIQTRSYA